MNRGLKALGVIALVFFFCCLMFVGLPSITKDAATLEGVKCTGDFPKDILNFEIDTYQECSDWVNRNCNLNITETLCGVYKEEVEDEFPWLSFDFGNLNDDDIIESAELYYREIPNKTIPKLNITYDYPDSYYEEKGCNHHQCNRHGCSSTMVLYINIINVVPRKSLVMKLGTVTIL